MLWKCNPVFQRERGSRPRLTGGAWSCSVLRRNILNKFIADIAGLTDASQRHHRPGHRPKGPEEDALDDKEAEDDHGPKDHLRLRNRDLHLAEVFIPIRDQ